MSHHRWLWTSGVKLHETICKNTTKRQKTCFERDTTLEAFARHKPKNPEETKRLAGMDEVLFRRVGYRFLNAVLDEMRLRDGKKVTAE